jgi:protein-tyrosine-phosphatase/DNA-binding transcriptional ArsR family regulator
VETVVRTEKATAHDAPLFLRLAAHPVRWRLLQELVRSDRAVKELTALLDERQSLVSYHLGQLRDGGLVRSHRSSADGRDSYYAVDLAGCEQQLHAAGGALHPALAASGAAPASAVMPDGHRRRVLFLCTGNSARSQMAEALLASMSAGTVDVASAGSAPKVLHPLGVQVMAERGIDIRANRTKHLDVFVAERFDWVITLCDRVREVCPEFPSHPELVHWSVPDPALVGPGTRQRLAAFRRTADELEQRIRFLLRVLEEPSTRRSTHG